MSINNSYTVNSNKKLFKELITRYQEVNFSFIPLPYKSKVPSIEWRAYQTTRPDNDTVQKWFDDGAFGNIAIITGKVSAPEGQTLVILDFDSTTAFEKFKEVADKTLGSLTDSTPVVRTSRGYHVYFYVHGDVPSKKFPNLDIQSDGKYVLAPPSTHPMGLVYEFVNPEVTAPLFLFSLLDVGIDLNQPGPDTPKNNNGENWVTTAIQGVSEGQRNDTCAKLAGYYLGHGLHPDIVKTTLYTFADKCLPPLPHVTVDKVVDSVNKREENSTICCNANGDTLINPNYNMPDESLREAKRGQVGGQKGTKGDKFYRNHGELASAFDDLMSSDPSCWQDKGDIAGQLGTSLNDDAYQKLIQRRKSDGKIRQNKRNPRLIQWINKSYKVVDLSDNSQDTYLPIKLPLGVHELVKVPQGSVSMVAGFTSAGKTAYQLEIASLNALSQDKPVYYWFNEMSESKFKTRLDDFPNLYEAWKQGKFKPVKQGDFEFQDTVEPDAINIYDYIDRDDDLYLISQDIKQMQLRLSTGVAFIAIQKKAGETFGYGGLPTAKLSNLYITLDCNKEQSDFFSGRAKIVKAKDWTGHNPVYMACNYKTTGKHGRLEIEGIWGRGL